MSMFMSMSMCMFHVPTLQPCMPTLQAHVPTLQPCISTLQPSVRPTLQPHASQVLRLALSGISERDLPVLFSLLGEVANVLGGLVVAGRADQQLPLLRLVLTTRAAATRALPRIGCAGCGNQIVIPPGASASVRCANCGAFSHFVDGAQITPSGGGGGGGFSVVAGSSGSVKLWWVVGIFTPRAWLLRGDAGRLVFLRLLREFVSAASSVPRDDQRELLRCFALTDFEPRRADAEDAELSLLLPAMISRRALCADGARLLSAAATPRAAWHGRNDAPYTPSPAMLALAQQHREAILTATRTAEPPLAV